ncbi:gamma-taxilin-like [Teleopsis dalmanni]|uniref:gamma-taxilin-like n=1 Tax=Teleopsis dalmanni TaxID=139649 RepID=UPI0018CE6EBC|nr:gamma-taxilin-like [Teleopsis dalmanni]XP_037947098.1 gamma-taxilin-like [Teleopsis dalmanni]
MDKSAKSKREAREEKQKDLKFEEQILKSLEETTTSEQKFELLLKKYIESDRESRRIKQDLKEKTRNLEVVQREKENLQREHNKNVLMKDKLQEVCREQQKLIKSVKNESLQKIRDEEERRKETQLKFQSSLNEITQSLSKNNEENLKLRDHNVEMTQKLKFLADQYRTRELQMEKLNEQVQLESQLHQAKLNKVEVASAMEKEILIKEKQIALEKLLQTQTALKELAERETALKEQLNLYTAKYDDFQSSLKKSNDVFTTYKIELEKMSKNTKKLEKESLEWKHKWEKSNATLIELATEKQERDDHAKRCNKQVEQLQKLLRALQHERTHLYNSLRDNNIELPVLPPLPLEPAPIQTTPITSVTDKDKMEVMTKYCDELKQTLASLQNQIKEINIQKSAEESKLQLLSEAHTKQQKQPNDESKKSKSKKKSKAKKKKAIEKESTPDSVSSLNKNANEDDDDLVNVGDENDDDDIAAEVKRMQLNAKEIMDSAIDAAVASMTDALVANVEKIILSDDNLQIVDETLLQNCEAENSNTEETATNFIADTVPN